MSETTSTRPAASWAKYQDNVYLRGPKAFRTTVRIGARKNATTISDYVKVAIFAQLKRDGVAVDAGEAA